jgi:predicted nicotinamide N-methyase
VSLRPLILEHTKIARCRLCPEIRLRLVTEDCALFHASEEKVAEMGIPEPFWAFSWAGGEAVARFVLDHPEWVKGRSVLVFGCGCGIDAIAAALSGGRVCAADIDPAAREATAANAELNGVAVEVSGEDLLGVEDLAWEVVLVGDVCYEEHASRAILEWLGRLAGRGITVLVGDPHRGYVERAPVSLLASYDAPADNDRHGRSLTRTSVFRIEPLAAQPHKT